jgi:hypothetical protein
MPTLFLKDSPAAIPDHRLLMDGTPLRACQDVSYLNLRFPGRKSYLYERVSSVVISGIDQERWTVYCFGESEPGDSAQRADAIRTCLEDEQSTCVEVANQNPLEHFLVTTYHPLRLQRKYLKKILDRVNQAIQIHMEVRHGHCQVHCHTFAGF